jgi:hypothetical protein
MKTKHQKIAPRNESLFFVGDISTLCNIQAPTQIAAAGNAFLVLSNGPTPCLFNVTREGKFYLLDLLISFNFF